MTWFFQFSNSSHPNFFFFFLFFVIIKSSSKNIDWAINDDSLQQQQRFHPFSPKDLFSNALIWKNKREKEKKNYKNHSADDSQFNGFLLSLNYSCYY